MASPLMVFMDGENNLTIKSRLGGMFGIGIVDFRPDLAQFSTVV